MDSYGFSPSTGKHFVKHDDGRVEEVSIDKVPPKMRMPVSKPPPEPAGPPVSLAAPLGLRGKIGAIGDKIEAALPPPVAKAAQEFGKFQEKYLIPKTGAGKAIALAAPLMPALEAAGPLAEMAEDIPGLGTAAKAITSLPKYALGRMAATTAAGALGEKAQGGSALSGAEQGLAAGALGEIPGAASATATTAKRLANEDNASVGSVVGKILKLPFERSRSLPMWMRLSTKEPVSERFESEMGNLSKQIGDIPIVQAQLTQAELAQLSRNPSVQQQIAKTMTKPTTFEQAREQLRRLSARAFKAGGGMRDGERAQEALEQWIDLHGQVIKGLRDVNPQWAAEYGRINGDYEKWKTLSRIFSDDGLLTARGDFDMSRLHEILRDEGGLQRLKSVLSPDEYQAFVSAASRGQGFEKGIDIPGFMRRGTPPRIRLSEHGSGTPNIFGIPVPLPTRENPVFSRYIGNVPPGGGNLPRTASTMGFNQLIDLFRQASQTGSSKGMGSP